MYRGTSLRYEKDMESRRARQEFDARQRQKKFVLGPSLSCPLYSKSVPTVMLRIPMVMYHKEIWEFWRGKKFRWNGAWFKMTVTGNMEKWLDRARLLYYQMWDNVNEGREWNENLST